MDLQGVKCLILYIRENSVYISGHSLPLLGVHPWLLLWYLVLLSASGLSLASARYPNEYIPLIPVVKSSTMYWLISKLCLVFWFLCKCFYLFFQVLMGKCFLLEETLIYHRSFHLLQGRGDEQSRKLWSVWYVWWNMKVDHRSNVRQCLWFLSG